MAKSSKKCKADRKSIRQDQHFSGLDSKFTNLPASLTKIDGRVAILPDELSSFDGQNYQLIFQQYKHNECELHSLDKKETKPLVQTLKKITQTNAKNIRGGKLIRDQINPSGKYLSLYKELPPDINLFEIAFTKAGRIIVYFINEYQHSNQQSSYCCIIAIWKKHR